MRSAKSVRDCCGNSISKELIVSDQPRICAPTISRPKWHRLMVRPRDDVTASRERVGHGPPAGFTDDLIAQRMLHAKRCCKQAEKRQMLHLPHQTTAPTYDSKHAVARARPHETEIGLGEINLMEMSLVELSAPKIISFRNQFCKRDKFA